MAIETLLREAFILPKGANSASELEILEVLHKRELLCSSRTPEIHLNRLYELEKGTLLLQNTLEDLVGKIEGLEGVASHPRLLLRLRYQDLKTCPNLVGYKRVCTGPIENLRNELKLAVEEFMSEHVEVLLPTQSFITPEVPVLEEEVKGEGPYVEEHIDMYIFAKYSLTVEVYWNLADNPQALLGGSDEQHYHELRAQLVRPEKVRAPSLPDEG